MCLPQIIDYATVSSVSLKDLSMGVQKGIEKGYEPFGSMIVGIHGIFIQPMVLYSRPESKAEPPLLTTPTIS